MKVLSVILGIGILSIITGCMPPAHLMQVNHYEIGYCKSYAHGWETTVDVLLTHNYEIRAAHRSDGFFRTQWLYKTYPSLQTDVRVRFIANFLPDRPVVRVTPDVEFLSGDRMPYKELPIVADVLNELEMRLKCVGEEPPPPPMGRPPIRR